MRNFYLTLAASAIATTAMAQQLPNVGFEGEWTDSRPWNTITDTLSIKNATIGMEMLYPNGIFGLQPAGWVISNVNGVVSEKSDDDYNVIGYAGLGATEVGKKTAGYNSESAVLLQNSPNPFMSTQIVPAYISLGTTWATNTLDFFGSDPIQNKDGGVFGGMEFSSRPDALAMMYKRGEAEGDAHGEGATVLVYAWKGTWTQDNVPGNNSMSAETVKTTMTDRDRNILGMETAQGDPIVKKSDDAALIAKALTHIKEQKSEWTEFILPISYLSDATPSKINVVIAANDYFDSVNINNGDSLAVDDVRFVYFSHLDSIKVNGTVLPDFKSDVYEYRLPGDVPASADAIEAFLAGEGKTAKSTVKIEGNTVTITVSNENGADADGLSEHVYTLTFGDNTQEGVSYNGLLNINMMGTPIADNTPATITIYPEGDKLCTFTLPNFSIDLEAGPMLLGDIIVKNVKTTTDGNVTNYEGGVKGLSLAEGTIVADVDIKGTIDNNGKADMLINVMWNEIPIIVTFTSEGQSGIEAIEAAGAPVEYYNLNGTRMNGDNLPAGIYVRRQGNKATKIIVR